MPVISPRAVKATAGGVGCVVILSTLTPLRDHRRSSSRAPGSGGVLTGRYAETFPMSVPLNGTLEIDDRTATGTETR